MGLKDKISNATEDSAGKAKEAAGKVTGNHDTEAEGRGDQAKAGMKKTGENIKDAAKDVTGN